MSFVCNVVNLIVIFLITEELKPSILYLKHWLLNCYANAYAFGKSNHMLILSNITAALQFSTNIEFNSEAKSAVVAQFELACCLKSFLFNNNVASKGNIRPNTY